MINIMGEIITKLDELIAVQRQILHAIQLQAGSKPTPNEWLDSHDVKRLLKIGESTLYRMRKQGNIPCKKIGKKWYYPHTALMGLVLSKSSDQ